MRQLVQSHEMHLMVYSSFGEMFCGKCDSYLYGRQVIALHLYLLLQSP